MSGIAPLATNAATSSSDEAVSRREEAQASRRDDASSARTDSTSGVAAVRDQAQSDDVARTQRMAQARADITGTGLLVDITV